MKHTSNKLNILADKLIDKINQRTNLFDDFVIVTPSLKVEQWFKAYWLKNQDNVLMNVKFIRINKFFSDILKIDNIKHQATNTDYLFFIIKHLLNDDIFNILPDSIKEYIKEKNNINTNRLYDLSLELADLFIKYEQELTNITSWQSAIYSKVLVDIKKHYAYSLLDEYSKTDHFNISNNKSYIIFGFNKFNKLQESIITEYSKQNDLDIFVLDSNDININNDDVTIISSPSILKEVEAVHGEICELLKDKNTKYSDFLMVVPSFKEYGNVIGRVFKQDDELFPNIPYVLCGEKNEHNDFKTCIDILLNIITKGYFTRKDFFKLVNIDLIKTIRNITDEEIKTFSDTIINLEVYRNGVSDLDQWMYLMHRVALSKIVDNNDLEHNLITLPSGQKYYSYSSIGLNDDTLSKFINLVNDIFDFSLIKVNNYINYEDIKDIYRAFNNFFKDYKSLEISSLLNEISNFTYFFYGNYNVELSLLINYLSRLDFADPLNNNLAFSSGITVTEYDKNTILNAKYVFILGCSNNNYPIKNVRSEIDLSELKDDIKEQKDIFNLTLNNYNNKLFISYVNIDLKSYEEFYISNFVKDLFDINKLNTININLDEKRDWNKLYTKAEFKNKDYNLGLLSNKETEEKREIEYNPQVEKVITVKNLADFFTEPLKNKAIRTFGRFDETDDYIQIEYEPVSFRALDINIIFKEILNEVIKDFGLVEGFDVEKDPESICRYTGIIITPVIKEGENYRELIFEDLENGYKGERIVLDGEEVVSEGILYEVTLNGYKDEQINFVDGYYPGESLELLIDSVYNNLPFMKYLHKKYEEYVLKNKVPSLGVPDFGSFEPIIEKLKYTMRVLYNYTKFDFENLKCGYYDFDKFILDQDYPILKKVKNDEIFYFELKEMKFFPYKSNEDYKYLFLYISALFDALSFDDDLDHSIRLIKAIKGNRKFVINRKQAFEILIAMCDLYMDLSDNYLMTPNKLYKDEDDIDKFVNDIINSSWSYYEDEKIFELDKHSGYERDTFKETLSSHKEVWRDLLRFIKKEEDKKSGK